MPEPSDLAPVLLVPDVGATLDYYRDVLGFEEVRPWELAPDEYGYATRGRWTFHFSRAERATPNSALVPPDLFDVYLWLDDVNALHEELVGRGADILLPPKEQPWQMLEIRVRDLNGYVLGFGQPLR